MANDGKRFCIAAALGLVDQLLMEKSNGNGSKPNGPRTLTPAHTPAKVSKRSGDSTKELIFT